MAKLLIQNPTSAPQSREGHVHSGPPYHRPHHVALLFVATAAGVHHTHAGTHFFEAVQHGASWALVLIIGCWLIGLTHETMYFARKAVVLLRRNTRR